MSKRTLWLAGVFILVLSMVLSACGGEPASTSSTDVASTDTEATSESTATDTENTEVSDAPADTPTPTVEEKFPDVLVIHPDAFDLEATTASNTFVYIVPGVVADITEYLLEALSEKGWEGLGKPTVMGHLATINMQMGKARLTVNMQDNERTETTRVQMTLVQ